MNDDPRRRSEAERYPAAGKSRIELLNELSRMLKEPLPSIERAYGHLTDEQLFSKYRHAVDLFAEA